VQPANNRAITRRNIPPKDVFIFISCLDEGEPVQSVSRSLKNEGHKLLDLKKVDGHYVLRVEVVE
jgi:hypothetical protein